MFGRLFTKALMTTAVMFGLRLDGLWGLRLGRMLG